MVLPSPAWHLVSPCGSAALFFSSIGQFFFQEIGLKIALQLECGPGGLTGSLGIGLHSETHRHSQKDVVALEHQSPRDAWARVLPILPCTSRKPSHAWLSSRRLPSFFAHLASCLLAHDIGAEADESGVARSDMRRAPPPGAGDVQWDIHQQAISTQEARGGPV